MEKEWYIIINPNSGLRKGEKDWPLIQQLLVETGISFNYRFSEYHLHAIALAEEGIREGYRKLMAIGGDGTINEVVNGIFSQDIVPTQDITISAITIGTGNDWGRMFDIPSDYASAIDVIARETTFLQDAGFVIYQNGTETASRYFINIAGLGFDAIVAKKTNNLKEKGKGSSFSYLTSLFSSLLKYKHQQSEITVDETRHKVSTKLFSMNVGICQYNGGGMKQVPEAIPDDGLFDLTVISKMKKRSVIRHVRKIYKGTHVKLPFVQTFRGKTVVIESSNPIWLEVDGESLGHTPLEFTIIPRSIKVVVG